MVIVKLLYFLLIDRALNPVEPHFSSVEDHSQLNKALSMPVMCFTLMRPF
jgi:hypothetical protein